MIDGQQSDEQYMRELYERFLNDIRNNINTEFYEEDELLDIYDYAQDEGDEMAQLFVLMAGARLYPDSNFLDERRAFFLSSINETAAKKLLDRKGRKDTALWQVLKLSLDTYPEGNPENGLADLLASDYKFSCETVIRLLDMLHDLNRDDLIAENLNILKQKASNPTLLCYEAAETLYRNERYTSLARDIADELTQKEPFNPDNWTLLATIEFALAHHKECIEAAEYALAIDPDNQNATMVKGFGLLANNETRDEGIELMRQILVTNPDNSFAARTLADTYAHTGRKKAAIEVYASLLDSSDDNGFIIMDIMRLHPEDPTPYLEMFASKVKDNERKWIDIALQLANEGNANEAVRLLQYYNDCHTLHDGMEYMLQLHYLLRNYDEYIRLFNECASKITIPGAIRYEFSANAYLLLAASFMMSKKYDEAIGICNLMLNDMPKPHDYDDHLRLKGMALTLTFIRNLSQNPSSIPVDKDFDPVTFNILNNNQ